MPENEIIAPNEKVYQAQYKLDGMWLGASDYDASEIGPNNFKTLKNMRYLDKHPKQVNGYTVLNDTAIETYVDIKAGIQLRTNRTNPSHVIVAGNSGSNTRLFESTDSIPSAITFSAITTGRSGGAAGSAYNDDSGNTPRLHSIPQRHVAYSNEEASYIYGGPQLDCSGFFLCDNTDLDNPRDYWEQVRNSLSSDTVTVDSAGADVFTVHSTRPLHGVWYTVVTPNASASTLTGHVWTSSGWVALGNPTDGTTDGGVALAQSGELVFDSTVATAALKHFEGTFLYCYRFQLSAGSAVISQVQVDAPFQPIVDIWSGIPTNAMYAGIYFSSKHEEFTAHVIDSSTLAVPIGLLLDGLTSSDKMYLMFEEKTSAVMITMLANLVNTTTATVAVKYWDGDSFAAVSNSEDGTLTGGKTFAQSGLISWTPPSAEFPYTIGSKTGYVYEFTPSATINGTHGDATDSVVIDTITGIPSPISPGPYKFHGQFRGYHLGCGAVSEKEGNRIDFCAPYAIDVWNGFASSNNRLQSVYLDSDEDVTCGMSLYNRIGSVDRLFESYVCFTHSNMFQFKVSDSDDAVFDVDKISSQIGCPAPGTLTSTNIGMEVGPDGRRMNMLLWVDSSGPYSFDGSTPVGIPGIERYFDPNDSLYVGADLSSAHAEFDSTYREWNLVLPGDVWVVYDLQKRRWFQKDTGTAETPTCMFQVVDANGSKYGYGGIGTGEVVRLEYGNTWDGSAIVAEFWPGDFWPDENIWHKVRARRLKLVAMAVTGSHSVEIYHEADTKPSSGGTFQYYPGEFSYYDGQLEQYGSVATTLSLAATDGNRLVRATRNTNFLAWVHSYGFKLSTTDTANGLEPVGWGIEFTFERDDH